MTRNPIKFEVIKKWWRKKKYHARIISSNGEIMFSSAGQYNRKDAYDSIKTIQEHAFNAVIEFTCDKK